MPPAGSPITVRVKTTEGKELKPGEPLGAGMQYEPKIETLVRPLEPAELENTWKALLKLDQQVHFGPEITALQNGKAVGLWSRLISCWPRIDAEGLVRAAACLRNASFLPQGSRTPILLAPNRECARLLVEETHRRTLKHGGRPLAETAELNSSY